MMPDNLFTFDALATLAGASFLCHLVVQYTKNLLDQVLPIPTDLYAVVVGALILLLAQFALGASAGDWRVYVLSAANGFLVAAVAGQIANKAVNPPALKPLVNDTEAVILPKQERRS